LEKFYFKILSVFCSLGLILTAYGQTTAVTPFSFDQDLRVLQLQGKLTLDNSMNIRPISFNKKFTADSLYRMIGGLDKKNLKEAKIDFWKGNGKIALLPFTSITKFSSHHPFGWSDGAFMPSNGLQQLVTLGVYGSIGPLSLQVKPEYLYAQDKPYETTSRFGPQQYRKNFKKFFLGQSRAALNLGPFSFAMSTENLWWGPGQFSSLMLSNHAPGFLHASINTRRPIKTKIGNFEFQVIGGKMTEEYVASDELSNLRNYNNRWGAGKGTEDITKYINAFNFVYTPSFIQTMSVGITRGYTSSAGNIFGKLRKELGFRKTFLPIVDGFFKETRLAFEDSLGWNQLVSLFTRIQFPKQSAEIYLEYGWNDHKFNSRDLIMSPTHSAAYIVGVKKILTLSSTKHIDFNVEYSQMAQQVDRLTRDAGNWYIHYQGSNFSHLGQTLGSGIGYGSNALNSLITFRNKYDQLGFFFSYIQNDPIPNTVIWNDFQFGLQARKKLNSFLLNLNINNVFSRNYAWQLDVNRFNFMGMMGVSYFF
jgi:hypothetical protein